MRLLVPHPTSILQRLGLTLMMYCVLAIVTVLIGSWSRTRAATTTRSVRRRRNTRAT